MKTPNFNCHGHGTHKLFVNFLSFSFLFFFSIFSYSQQIAFPSAEGFGKYASGGRGGSVIKVTNLNDSGSGSLRAALTASGTRTIVFEVGGTITLNSNIYVTSGNLTIAGQTAPGGGILIKGGMVQFEASNIIVRHIRFRSGPSAGSGTDSVSITAWSGNTVENVIFDHCSISWGDDENFNIRGVGSGIVRKVTLQNSIISESGYGVLGSANTYNLSFYKNLFAHNSERNIRTNYPVSGTMDFEMVNNLIYGFRYSTMPSLGAKFTVLNNKYKKSSQVSMSSGAVVEGTSSGAGVASQTYAYINGNILAQGASQNNSALNPYLESSPFSSTGIEALSASSLEGQILQTVGANLPSRDAVDTRIINQYNAGNGTLASSGIYPTIANGTAATDSDNDGMPNSWELANGLNPNDASDRNIVQPDGYTNLEYYLNGMTLGNGNETITANAGEDQTICEGESVTLTATGGTTYEWSNGETTASIEVSPEETTTYTVTAFEGSSSDSDEVTVNVNPLPNANAGNDVSICEGNSVTLTAFGGSSYLWSTGATTQTITVSPNATTTYSVEVTSNACSATDEVTVNVNEISQVNAGNDVTIGFGESVTLTATGASTYSWNTGINSQSITVSPTQTTTYQVTGYSNGCETTDSVTVFLVDNSVIADAGQNQEICQGESITLTATGGSTYEWSNGATTASITVTPNETTTYTVTVYSNMGSNSDTDQVTVTVNQLPNASAGNDVSICEGESITLTATGGNNYLWNTGATSQSITVSPNSTTTYSVEVSSNSCTASDDVTVTVNELPVVDAGANVTITEGESVTLTATGGNTYLWNTGATAATITVSPAVTTTYEVTGFVNGCEATDTVTVTVEEDTTVIVNANAGEDQTICQGSNVTLTATGGDTYLWNTGETTASITVSPEATTTYSVTAYIGENEGTDEVTVTVNELPVVDAGANVTITEGESVTLTATGGNTYVWNTGATAATITVSPAVTTTYEVTGFVNGCEATDTVTVTVEEDTTVIVNANAGEDQTICQGSNVTLTATGGDTYLWNTGETTASITVSPEATTTYSVTAYIGENEGTDEVTVTVNELPVVDAGANVTITEGESVTLTATGGNTYVWNTGATAATITVSPAVTTTYEVTGFVNGCEATDTVTVTVEEDTTVIVNANAGEDQTICQGSNVTLTATGGDTYLWNTGETTASITVSPEATTTYSVTAYIGENEGTDDVTVTVNELPVVDAGANVTITEGESVTLTATGGNTYVWNTGATAATITVSPAVTTTYEVTGFVNGCEATDTVTVTVEEDTTVIVNANAGEDQTICLGSTVTLTATGGDSYLWNTGETTASITVSPEATTTYSVTAYIGENEGTDDVTVTVNELPVVDAGTNVTITEGESVTLTATGGNTYVWNTGATAATITVSPAVTTTYEVTGFANGCEATDTVTVTVEEDTTVIVNANAGEDQTICQGSNVTLTATGGDTYLWNTGETTASITVSPEATTTYSVTAYIGESEGTDDVTITVNELPVVDAGANVIITEGESVTLTATGGNTYVWNTGATAATITVSPAVTTTYEVTGFANGCEAADTVTVTVEEDTTVIVNANAGEDQTICQGSTVTLTATGGDTYLWNTGETTASITVSPEATTTYSVTAYIGESEGTDDVTVTVNELPIVDAGTNVTITEGESVTLTATGGNTYVWNTGATAATITVSPAVTTTYEVTGFVNGCEATDTVIVTVEEDTTVIVNVNAGEDQTICQGSTVTLTATGGDSYLWNTGETTASITVSPEATTTYSVTAYIGENEGTDDVTVTVNPIPNVSITNGEVVTILLGDYVTLSATGANNYIWSNGATEPNIAVSPAVTTTYEVTGFVNGCEATQQVIVKVIEPVSAEITAETLEVCLGESVVLTASGGDEYLWSTGETTQSITVTPEEATEYTVTVYNELDEDQASISINVVDCAAIVAPEITEGEFTFYFDKISDLLTLNLSGYQSVQSISIYDMQGNLVYQIDLNQLLEGEDFSLEVDTSTFKNGAFIIRVVCNGNEVITKKTVFN
ncbi:hypothetical protein [Mangrovimonas sp. YM274]|uniref:hypothetical protein n=1 Tax=Mangrovimonas sp. YM274 TaxID=3070660 RepID=UPI0027DD031B|nr:hypothetical protein [Mangrovimonas sp. YM274]WMI67276.1 hypothetical protein RBH95_08965 [Mangrovimonas sp. YM274]